MQRSVSKQRCAWCGDSVLYQTYHDTEWGVPLHDDRALFEFFILEGAQAGLSWITILKKRENYRAAFDGFDAARVARYGAGKIAALLQDPGIVRNRLKVASAVTNAQKFLEVQAEFGSFTDSSGNSSTASRSKTNGAASPISLPAQGNRML